MSNWNLNDTPNTIKNSLINKFEAICLNTSENVASNPLKPIIEVFIQICSMLLLIMNNVCNVPLARIFQFPIHSSAHEMRTKYAYHSQND